jgi:hypothetical protein
MDQYMPVYHTGTSSCSWISYRHLTVYTILICPFPFLRYILVSLLRGTGTSKLPFQALHISTTELNTKFSAWTHIKANAMKYDFSYAACYVIVYQRSYGLNVVYNLLLRHVKIISCLNTYHTRSFYFYFDNNTDECVLKLIWGIGILLHNGKNFK